MLFECRVDGETKRYDGYRRNNDRMIALEAGEKDS